MPGPSELSVYLVKVVCSQAAFLELAGLMVRHESYSNIEPQLEYSSVEKKQPLNELVRTNTHTHTQRYTLDVAHL